MKKLLFALCALALYAAAPATAGICDFDNEPAASLLLPYFEVDLDNPSGRTTIMTIGNSEAAATIVNVVVWSDLGVPVLSFNLYLTGYDVHSINLRDLFSSQVAQNTGPTITPAGNFSDPNTIFPGCESIFPGPPALPDVLVTHMRSLLTGGPSPVFEGRCAGRDLGDNIARGYVTVDVLDECTVEFPTDEGYFDEGGPAGYANVLFGDYSYIDVQAGFAQAENLVRLQADPSALDDGDLTFYGSRLNYDGSDAREPLTQQWAARYLVGSDFDLDTDLVIWRDPLFSDSLPFDCGSLPSWFPLRHGSLIMFDEEENGADPTSCPICSPPFFTSSIAPAVTQRVSVLSDLLAWFDAGWLRLDLTVPLAFPLAPPIPVATDQALVVGLIQAEGRFSVGAAATPLGEACRSLNLP